MASSSAGGQGARRTGRRFGVDVPLRGVAGAGGGEVPSAAESSCSATRLQATAPLTTAPLPAPLSGCVPCSQRPEGRSRPRRGGVRRWLRRRWSAALVLGGAHVRALRGLRGGPERGSTAAVGLDRAAGREVQEGLRAAGCDPGSADGMFGPRGRVLRSGVRRRLVGRERQGQFGLGAAGRIAPSSRWRAVPCIADRASRS